MNIVSMLAVKAPHCNGILRLPVSGAILSPYWQMNKTNQIGTGRNIKLFPIHMAVTKAIATAIGPYIQDLSVYVQFRDGSNAFVDEYNIELPDGSQYTTAEAIASYAETQILAYATSHSYSAIATVANILWLTRPLLPTAAGPSSYQTIVSQTGTAAPAISGSLVPTSTYPSGTTFTWARTGTGVYTLTASTAVFNTSGKTGIFIGGLNNLNGSWKAVVTSSTVITITTALQSLAVLGLLGFTATPTDALLTQTMVYVQTYT